MMIATMSETGEATRLMHNCISVKLDKGCNNTSGIISLEICAQSPLGGGRRMRGDTEVFFFDATKRMKAVSIFPSQKKFKCNLSGRGIQREISLVGYLFSP